MSLPFRITSARPNSSSRQLHPFELKILMGDATSRCTSVVTKGINAGDCKVKYQGNVYRASIHPEGREKAIEDWKKKEGR